MNPHPVHPTGPDSESIDSSDNSNNTEDHIWSLPGLSKEQFYAAAYFLGQNQTQQVNNDYPAASKTPENTKSLLDAMSLLFARAYGHTSDTPANVTAIALEVTDQQKLVFHAAKNGGPLELEGIGDRDFANQLAKWMRDAAETPKLVDGIWPDMVKFWGQRVQKYLRTLPKSADLKDYKAGLEEHFKYDKSGLAAFEKDFPVLANYIKVYEQHGRKNTPACVLDMCVELSGPSEHEYIKYSQTKDEEKQDPGRTWAEKFRKAVKHIKLLRNLRQIYDGVALLRKEYPGTVFEFTFLPQRPSRWLDMKNIIETMKLWAALPDANSKFQEDVDRATNCYSRQGGRRRLFFHCELQLLEHCIISRNSRSFCDYFGCSKLSCHLCWKVLQNAEYQTKGTHSVLRADCFFPFQVSSSTGHYHLAALLKRVQDNLLNRILKYSMQLEDKLTKYDLKSETNAYPRTQRLEIQGLEVQDALRQEVASHSREELLDEMTFDVLKLTPSGESAIERMTFSRRPEDEPNGEPPKFRMIIPRGQHFDHDNRYCRHPEGVSASKWIADIQLKQEWIVDENAIVSLNRNIRRILQWVPFKICLDNAAGHYADIQVLCRMDDDERNVLPANHFRQHEPLAENLSQSPVRHAITSKRLNGFFF
jgi:hypothetical protein